MTRRITIELSRKELEYVSWMLMLRWSDLKEAVDCGLVSQDQLHEFLLLESLRQVIKPALEGYSSEE